MKQLLFLVLLAFPLIASAQKKVAADDVRGEWQVIFHLEDEADQADSALERVALRAVSGLLDEIDVRLLFLPDGVMRVAVTAFDEDADIDDDDAGWEINRHGGLIVGDSEHFHTDSDTVFYFEGDELVAFELNADGKPAARKGISLQRIDT